MYYVEETRHGPGSQCRVGVTPRTPLKVVFPLRLSPCHEPPRLPLAIPSTSALESLHPLGRITSIQNQRGGPGATQLFGEPGRRDVSNSRGRPRQRHVRRLPTKELHFTDKLSTLSPPLSGREAFVFHSCLPVPVLDVSLQFGSSPSPFRLTGQGMRPRCAVVNVDW